ncbi:MAG: hypothetical protein ABI477_09635 [Chryseolinea sp.]
MSELTYKTKTKKDLKTMILISWLIVGTLDMSAAVIQTLINGGNPVKMLQFIASGVFGTNAFTTEMPYALLGVVFHYIIAFGWTLLFFFLYPRLEFLSWNTIATGFLYGLLVWTIMNQVILRLANTPPIKFVFMKAIIATLILVFAIGVPLSFMAKKYFRNGN